MKVNVSHDGERNDGTNKEFYSCTSFSSNVSPSKSVTARSSTTSSLILDYMKGTLVLLGSLLHIEVMK